MLYLCTICKQEFGRNHDEAMPQIPELVCVSTSRTSMTLNIMRYETILGHSINKPLKLPSWRSFKCYGFLSGSLSPEIPGPPRREKKGIATAPQEHA